MKSKYEVKIVCLVTSSSPAWEKLSRLVESAMKQSSNWQKTVGILARILRATFQNQRGLIEVPLTADDLAAARRLQFLCSMNPSMEALKEGKLMSLGAKVVKGMFGMHGRIPKDDLARLLGKESLPVLMPQAPLAKLIMTACHTEDHRLGVVSMIFTQFLTSGQNPS